MQRIEMKRSDLCELYILMDLYERTYEQSEITAGELKECVRQKCEEQGMAGSIKNARNAGRKKKYSEETDRKVLEEYRCGKSIREIASETGCSTGYVQKLIYEHRYRQSRAGGLAPKGTDAQSQ